MRVTVRKSGRVWRIDGLPGGCALVFAQWSLAFRYADFRARELANG